VQALHDIAGRPRPAGRSTLLRDALAQVERGRAARGLPAPRSNTRDPLWPAALLKLKRIQELDRCERAAIVIAFLGLMRLGEIREGTDGHMLRACDVKVEDARAPRLRVTFRSAKWSHRATAIVLPATGGELCPVRAWLRLARAHRSADGPALCDARGDQVDGARLAAYLQAAQALAGGSTAKISAHSLRVGGATALVAAGLTRRAVQQHGRWSAAPGSATHLDYVRALPDRAWGGAREELALFAHRLADDFVGGAR
jgi:hypothetical protein